MTKARAKAETIRKTNPDYKEPDYIVGLFEADNPPPPKKQEEQEERTPRSELQSPKVAAEDTAVQGKNVWAVRLEFAMRQIMKVEASNETGNGDRTAVKELYEIGGMSENNRVTLEKLLREIENVKSDVVKNYRISILYNREAGENKTDPKKRDGNEGDTEVSENEEIMFPSEKKWYCSDRIERSATYNDVILVKTNLSTESRPFTTQNKSGSSPDVSYARIDEVEDFLKLLWQCGVVNSGGYFLRYSAGDEDPFRKLFESEASDSGNNGESTNDNSPPHQIPVTIIIEPGGTLDHPWSPSYNCVILHDYKVGTGDKHLYAKLSSREIATNHVRPVVHWDPIMQAGRIGFEVKRPVEDTLANNLYRLLTFDIDSIPGSSRKNIKFLPLAPQGTIMEETAGKKAGDEDDKEWRYERIIDYSALLDTKKESGEKDYGIHYKQIGKEIPVKFAYQDIFGNTGTFYPPDDKMDSVPKFKMQYYDRLIPLHEWPGVKVTLQSNSCQGLMVKVTCKIEKVFENNDVETVKKIYGMIRHQLRDSRVESSIERSFNSTSLPDQTTKLCEFARKIHDSIDSNMIDDIHHEKFRLTKNQNEINNPGDFFPLKVNLRIKRNGDEKLFWKNPDGGFVEGVREARTEIIPQIDKSDELQTFAKDFEIFYSGNHLKIAVGVGEYGRQTIWIVRAKRFAQPTKEGYELPRSKKTIQYFAPIPLSRELITENEVKVFEPDAIENNACKDLKKKDVTRAFSDIDLDEHARFFFEAFEKFMSPDNLSALIVPSKDSNGKSEPPICSRSNFTDLIEHKKSFAENMPTRLIEALFIDPGNESGKERAIEVFKQRVMYDLKNIYGIDTILQFPIETQLKFKGNHDGAENDKNHGINMFGHIIAQEPKANTNAQSIKGDKEVTFFDSKIHLKKDGNNQEALTILVDATKVEDPREPDSNHFVGLERNLAYEWTHIEYNIDKDEGADKYFSSSWLTLINPIKLEINNQGEPIPIPLPLREYPQLPYLKDHGFEYKVQENTTNAMEKTDRIGKALKAAREWTYYIDYKVNKRPQDRVKISLYLNNNPVKEQPQRTEEIDLWFQALVRFRHAFPAPEQSFAELRDVEIKRAKKHLTVCHFIERVSEVAEAARSLPSENKYQEANEVEKTESPAGETVQPKKQLVPTISKRIWPTKPEQKDNWANLKRDVEIYLSEPWCECGKNENESKDEKEPSSDKIVVGFECSSKPDQPAIQSEDCPNEEKVAERWRFGRLDIMCFEKAIGAVQVVRNRRLIPDSTMRTNPKFVYVTPIVTGKDPMAPLLVDSEEIDIAMSSEETIATHLVNNVFVRLLKGQPEMVKSRTMRIEAKYVFDSGSASVPIPSPARLVRPWEITVDGKVSGLQTAEKLQKSLELWRRYLQPRSEGRLSFDVIVFGFAAGANAKAKTEQNGAEKKEENDIVQTPPTLWLRKLTLPFNKINWQNDTVDR